VDRLARTGRAHRPFAVPLIKDGSSDFSFSGLKTAVKERLTQLGYAPSTGIPEAERTVEELLQAAGENSGSHLAVLDGQIASAADGAGTVFWRERGSVLHEAIHFAITLLGWHGEQMWIFGLAVREGKRRLNRGAKGVFVDAIRSGARGAAIDYSTDRNIQAALGDVLVDGVVGEARERVGGLVDVNFGFVSASGFGQAQDQSDECIVRIIYISGHGFRNSPPSNVREYVALLRSEQTTPGNDSGSIEPYGISFPSKLK